MSAIDTISPKGAQEPICSLFGLCGGCAFQDLSPDDYRRMKKNFVVAALRAKGLNVPVADVWPLPAHSRRRATFEYRAGVVGFHENKSHNIVAVDVCPVLTPAFNDFLPMLRQLAACISGAGDVSVLMTDAGADVAFHPTAFPSPKGKAKKKPANLCVAVLQDLMTLCQSAKIARLSYDNQLLYQSVTLPFPPDCFMQPSVAGQEKLTALVLEAVKDCPRVLDLFCGIGTFTIPLAQAGHAVLGADITAAAIKSLQKAGVSAVVRDLFRQPFAAAELGAYDAVVLDPARAGAKAQCAALASSTVLTVVMVSCNPITMAADLATLTAGGYQILSVQPVDQFIYTKHLECVCILKKM